MPAARPRVEVRRSPRRTRTGSAHRDGDTVVVCVPTAMPADTEQQLVERLVAKVLAREEGEAPPSDDTALAERAEQLAVRYLGPVLPVAPRPTQVRWVTNQQQRWGSCTPQTGVIRLSHRLRPMPAWVVDYVLLHELVHLVEPTHSARFWRLVEVYPDADRARGYLEGFRAGRTAADR